MVASTISVARCPVLVTDRPSRTHSHTRSLSATAAHQAVRRRIQSRMIDLLHFSPGQSGGRCGAGPSVSRFMNGTDMPGDDYSVTHHPPNTSPTMCQGVWNVLMQRSHSHAVAYVHSLTHSIALTHTQHCTHSHTALHSPTHSIALIDTYPV